MEQSDEQLLTLLAHDTDAFNRWEAAQRLALRRALAAIRQDGPVNHHPLDTAFIEAMRAVLRHPGLDAAFKELVLTFPAEGTGYEVGGMGIVKGAQHLDAAQKWFDWALEPSTQELGPQYEAYQAPTVTGAAASRPELLEVNLIDYDFDWCGSNKTAIVDRFTNEIANADNLKE